MASLPGISAVSYEICGVVRMFGSRHKAKVNSCSYVSLLLLVSHSLIFNVLIFLNHR